MVSGALLVRPVAASDHDEWRRLWQGYLEFYRTTLPESTVRTTWQRLLDPAEPMDAALAVLDDAPVGLAHFIEHRSCWTVGNYIYLQDLFVDPSVRGKGVGRRLIEHVYAEGTRRGCARVTWLTHETNVQACILYDQVAERSGFVQYRKVLDPPG